MSHPYTDHAAGWETLAGQDVAEGRYKTHRYLLVVNNKKDVRKAAILISPHPKRTGWEIFAEGKSHEMAKQFDLLDNGDL